MKKQSTAGSSTPGYRPLPTRRTQRAHVPHAFSLLFHAIATGAVTLLAAELLKNRPGVGLGATAGGLIFALHPIHVESVAWIAARADTLATLFFVLSLLALIQARRRGAVSLYAAAAGAYLLALLSKENAAVGVLLAPLTLRIHPEEPVARKPLFRPIALYGAVLALYMTLRLAGGGTFRFDRPPDLLVAARQVLVAAGFYIRKILIPWPLTPLPVELPGSAASLSFLGAGLAVLAVAALLYRRGERIYLFCLVWFVMACLPVLPVATAEYNLCSVAERYLYLPSVGFALAQGAAVATFAVTRRRAAANTALCVLLIAYGGTAWWSAATVWRNNLTLYSTMTRQRASARHPASWIGLGDAYWDRRNLVEAERCFLRALDGDVTGSKLQAGAWYALGKLRYDEGRLDEAIVRFRKAMALDPSYLPRETKHTLARVLEARGETKEAVTMYLQALDPRFPERWNNLGRLLVEMGRTEEAVRVFEDAIAIHPTEAALHGNLGTALAMAGKPELAERELRTAMTLDAAYEPARFNLGRLLLEQGRCEEAVEHLQASARLQPNQATTLTLLSEAGRCAGLPAEAAHAHRRHLEIDPPLRMIAPATSPRSAAAPRGMTDH